MDGPEVPVEACTMLNDANLKRVRLGGYELSNGTPSNEALPRVYKRESRSLRHRTGHGARLLRQPSGGSREATSTAPNGTTSSS